MWDSSMDRKPAKAVRLSKTHQIQVEEVSFDYLEVIKSMNQIIFEEERVINTFDREDLLMLMVLVDGVPAGFKIGYKQDRRTFYSAKGGILAEYRRMGLARLLLHDMIERVQKMGYRTFTYDTFPNKHPGMTILGLQEGFRVIKADFNTVFQDHRLQMAKEIAS